MDNVEKGTSNKEGKLVAYFCMEYAIDQSLKIYSGGLGYLAGSHLRSAYSLNKNLVAIGILWKKGYYDQVRDEEQNMQARFLNKEYSFLEDTGIKFTIQVNGNTVWVKAMVLPSALFGTAPLYLLTTDLPENDFLARSIVDRLYAPETTAKVAQSILLGIGGGMLLDKLGIKPDTYHLNEGHGLPLAFYLLNKYKNKEEVKRRLVFTTHTPEKAGNDEHDYDLLLAMGFFYSLELEEVKQVTGMFGDSLNYTIAALKLSRIANGVSEIHGKVSRQIWQGNEGASEIISITNAQKKDYWMDAFMQKHFEAGDDRMISARKKELKKSLFEVVADQTGKLFDPEVLTIVWARRFAGYKRVDLLLRDYDRFIKLINNTLQPVQVIWAGKPYPEDYDGVNLFNRIKKTAAPLKNCAVLTGYELWLSAMLKKGSDIWLNTPRYPREASGTSGMTAAMNGSVNFSVADGWVPEFAKHGINSFVIPANESPEYFLRQDDEDHNRLFNILETEVVPTYYKDKNKWMQIVKNSMTDVLPQFDSDRMIREYYEKMY